VATADVTLTLGNWQIIAVEVTTPDPFVMGVGGTQQIGVTVTATRYVTEDSGAFQESFSLDPVEAGTTYTSANESIATVNSTGLIEGEAEGQTTITVKAGGITDLIAVTINNSTTVASVDVSPTTATTGVGGTSVFSAVVRNSGGQQLLGKTVTWNSSQTGIATIGSDSGNENHQATATGVSAGTSNITATSETVQSTARVLTITSTAGTLYWADKFDSGDRSKNTNGFRWNTPQNPTINTLNPFPGDTYSMYHPYNGPGNFEQRGVFGQNLTEVYVGFYMWIDENYSHDNVEGADNNKFFRIWDLNYSTYHVKGGFSTRPRNNGLGESFGYTEAGYKLAGGGTTNIENQPGQQNYTNFFLSADRAAWTKWQLHFKLGSGADVTDGIVQARKNGTLVLNATTYKWYSTYAGANNFFKNWYILGAFNAETSSLQPFFTTRFRVGDGWDIVDPALSTGW
jgi:hypothetical protein